MVRGDRGEAEEPFHERGEGERVGGCVDYAGVEGEDGDGDVGGEELGLEVPGPEDDSEFGVS